MGGGDVTSVSVGGLGGKNQSVGGEGASRGGGGRDSQSMAGEGAGRVSQ